MTSDDTTKGLPVSGGRHRRSDDLRWYRAAFWAATALAAGMCVVAVVVPEPPAPEAAAKRPTAAVAPSHRPTPGPLGAPGPVTAQASEHGHTRPVYMAQAPAAATRPARTRTARPARTHRPARKPTSSRPRHDRVPCPPPTTTPPPPDTPPPTSPPPTVEAHSGQTPTTTLPATAVPNLPGDPR